MSSPSLSSLLVLSDLYKKRTVDGKALESCLFLPGKRRRDERDECRQSVVHMETLRRERTSHYAVHRAILLERQHLIDKLLENGQPSEIRLHFWQGLLYIKVSDLTLFGWKRHGDSQEVHFEITWRLPNASLRSFLPPQIIFVCVFIKRCTAYCRRPETYCSVTHFFSHVGSMKTL